MRNWFMVFVCCYVPSIYGYSDGVDLESIGIESTAGTAGNCLACHGESPTLAINVMIEDSDTINCFVEDTSSSDETKKYVNRNLVQLQHESTYTIHVEINGVISEEICPTHDCCGPSTLCELGGQQRQEDLLAPQQTDQCFELTGDCDDQPTATGYKKCCKPGYACCQETTMGLAVRSEGSGDLAPGEALIYGRERLNDNTKWLKSGTVTDNTWTFELQTPDAFNAADEGLPQLTLEAVSGNGNRQLPETSTPTYYADPLDQTGKTTVYFALGDELPEMCELCDDGTEPDLETGLCETSGCHQTPSIHFLGMLLLGGLFVRRRSV